jgi:nucleoid-associated protein YgaU
MFRVGDTDTLTTIAAEHLGRASRWQQIYRMNSDLLTEPEALRPGMELKLPADASRKRLVDRGREFR